jgi:hypothetical protein
MDQRDWAGMAQVFCRDARFDCSDGFFVATLDGERHGFAGPVTQGRDAIIAWISEAFAQQTSVHHGHCYEVTVHSETEAIDVIAMADFIFGPDRQTKVLTGAGHYHERYQFEHERYQFEDAAWRIAETGLTRLFVDIAQNLAGTADGSGQRDASADWKSNLKLTS